VVKIIAQYFNPIESFEEKMNFDEFQKFQRAKSLEFNVYLRSIQSPAKFEPNWKYA
jgi:hypothetical protein